MRLLYSIAWWLALPLVLTRLWLRGRKEPGYRQHVAERLGNTPSVCRKCYVHPEILDAYMSGELVDAVVSEARGQLSRELSELEPEEAAV